MVASASVVPIHLDKGLPQQADVSQMENSRQASEAWANVPWDPDRAYAVPLGRGLHRRAAQPQPLRRDINISAIFLDPLKGLRSLINVMPQMAEVMDLAIMYVGGEPCNSDRAVLEAA